MVTGINYSVNASTTNFRDQRIDSRNSQSDAIQARDSEISESNKTEQVAMDRVSMIKSQIENGQYKVDIQKTAEKMASDLLNI